jgi:uncharacterized protein (DUF427 family)
MASTRSGYNATWPRMRATAAYENPFPAVARIRGHVALYPDRVDAIEA